MSTAFAITTVLLILVLVDIIGNSLVCAMIWKNRNLRTSINILILNLAVGDALFAALIAPKLIVSVNIRHPGGWIGSVLCKLVTGGGLAWVGAFCSIYTLVAIAVERYYVVIYPRGKRWTLNNHKLKVIITASWIIAVTCNIPNISYMNVANGLCYEMWPDDWKIKAFSLFVTSNVTIALLLMVVLYSRVVFALWFNRGSTNPATGTFQQRVSVYKIMRNDVIY